MKLTRNKENERKVRPICSCNTQMTYVEFSGYYNSLEFFKNMLAKKNILNNN